MTVVLGAFDSYVQKVERLVLGGDLIDAVAVAPHLDGEAGRRLRSVVPIEELRELGAFFTGEVLARKVLSLVPPGRDRYVDPACGCGDLLLAASARLAVSGSLEDTLRHWNQRLAGRDLVPEFVRATRARLALAAILRGVRSVGGGVRPTALLTNIAVGDGLELRPDARTAVLVNPPYGRVPVPEGCAWSSGLTTEAAIFLDALLDVSSPGATIAAVLPEVLRGGSRYGRLRSAVERRLAVSAIHPAGVFDALTDVDVFLLAGTVRRDGTSAARWIDPPAPSRLEDICKVSVGAVVALRDPHRGPWRLYLDARSRGREAVVHPHSHRRFSGTVVGPPFVVVGRTNRPEDGPRPRLRATIVQASRPVAVENHLLCLVPHDHTISGCGEIAKIVESKRATAFLNHRLRCRHLTVGAVREIPL